MKFAERSYFSLSILSALIYFHSLISHTNASVCTGAAASPNWYGAAGYPPYFTASESENCPQKYSLSRCEQSAVMMDGTADFIVDALGDEACTPNDDCFPTKQNCNDTLVCSDLVKLKDELMEGGHNIICRHEKTFWSQYTGEVKGCHVNVNCLDPEVKQTQRQLQPLGWQSAHNFATALKEMGIPVDKTFSSPFTRCAEHAQVFSDEPNQELIELMYMSPWEEILNLNNITQKVKPNALKLQAYNIRNLAGKKPAAGKNNVFVTHGFNIKLAFGTAVDEGYCMVFKPEDTLPSLFDSIGSLTVGDKIFTFAKDSYPVDAIARMSPEAAPAMQTCDDVRSDAIDVGGDVLSSIDIDHDLQITRDEFVTAFGSYSSNANDAFDFVSSVVIQPEFLGRAGNEDVIELGQFYHINWGWREYAATGGDVSYPWRHIIENTIGPLGNKLPESRVAAFKNANSILSNLITVLKDDIRYPSKVEMERRLINCSTRESVTEPIDECFAQVSAGGDAYIPVGPGDGGAAALNGESIFNIPLAYPSEWQPGPEFYESRLLKVATCLVRERITSVESTLESMGCAPATPSPTVSANAATASPTVSPHRQRCAAESETAKSCGSEWHMAPSICCPGLVCDYLFKKCVEPEESPSESTSESKVPESTSKSKVPESTPESGDSVSDDSASIMPSESSSLF